MPGRRLDTLHLPLSRHRRSYPFHDRTALVTYCGRKDLHFQKENKSQHFSGGSSRRYQGGRRRHLAGDFYGLRSWLHRSRGKDSAALRQPFWPKGVSYVSGTICKGCLRIEHFRIWSGRWNRIASPIYKSCAFTALPPALRVNWSQMELNCGMWGESVGLEKLSRRFAVW